MGSKDMTRDALRLLTALIIVVETGCGDPTPLPVPLPATFNPKDANATFKWLIQVAMPISTERAALSKEHIANPLRGNFEVKDKALEDKWKQSVAGMVGKEVVWPAVVKRIMQEGVYVDGWPISNNIERDGYRLYLHFEDGPADQPHWGGYGGLLRLGQSITLEDAQKLMPNSWVYVSGTIAKVEGSLTVYGSDYISIHVEVTKAILPGPNPTSVSRVAK